MHWGARSLTLGSFWTLLAAACGVPDFGGFTDSTGGADAATDASGGSTGNGGSGGSGGSSTGGNGGSSGAGGATTSCSGDSDCTDPTPHCNTTTGKCVQCLPAPDPCPTGQYCASTSVCQSGCKTTSECNPDGGSGLLTCDTQSHKCKCQADDDCEPGKLCSTTTSVCVPGCTAQHVCAAGYDCCSGGCFLLNFEVSHCGSCGNACPANPPNAKPICQVGKCALNCNLGMFDCNKNASDGCEIDLFNDPLNCGECGKPCAPGQSCKTKVCG